MKVLRVINTMNPKYGGPCQGIRNSIPEMLKQGVINDVVCLDDPKEDFIHFDDFKIFALGKSKGPWSYNPLLISWLVKNLDSYDAVIIHGLWLYHGYATDKAIRIFRKSNPSSKTKYFVMPHGMLDPYFQKAKGRTLKAIRNLIYWAAIEQKVVNGADGVLFTCEEELLLARRPFRPYRPHEELNIGYGIQAPPTFNESMLSSFENAAGVVKDGTYILYLSRIHQKKGTDLLIKAFLKLKSELKSVPRLVIAGPGLDTAYGKEILAMAKGHDDIIFPGMISGDAKWAAFYGCIAYILPSHQENFGIAVVEALACHKPVIITKEVNIWREIEDSHAGIVVNDTEVGIYSALRELLNKTELELAIMSQEAYKLYLTKFNVKIAASILVKTLRDRVLEIGRAHV